MLGLWRCPLCSRNLRVGGQVLPSSRWGLQGRDGLGLCRLPGSLGTGQLRESKRRTERSGGPEGEASAAEEEDSGGTFWGRGRSEQTRGWARDGLGQSEEDTVVQT